MIVDSDLLRMGAAFSQSAGTIVQAGAVKLGETQLPSNIFGDFEAAHAFHRDLMRAHETYVSAMHDFRTEFESVADRAVVAATTFVTQDETSASSIESVTSLF